jgi:hypothetical protein
VVLQVALASSSGGSSSSKAKDKDDESTLQNWWNLRLRGEEMSSQLHRSLPVLLSLSLCGCTPSEQNRGVTGASKQLHCTPSFKVVFVPLYDTHTAAVWAAVLRCAALCRCGEAGQRERQKHVGHVDCRGLPAHP